MIDPREPDADIKMMSQPNEWPIFPRLPLKKRHMNNMVHSVLFVWHGKMYHFPHKNAGTTITPGELTADKVISYVGLEKLIQEGWVVD